MVTLGFLQRTYVNLDVFCSSIMDGITFHYLVNLAGKKTLDMSIMIVYFYKSLYTNINVKFHDGLKNPSLDENDIHNIHNSKMQKKKKKTLYA